MKKKTITVFLLCIMLASLFAGCAKTKEEPSAAETNAPAASPVSSAAVDKKPEDYKGEITVWTWAGDYFKERITNFNAVYPNVKINLVTMGWGDYLTKFETTKASGSGLPDVALAESYWWGKMLSYKDTFVDLSTLGFNQTDVIDAASKAVVNEQGKFVAIPEGLGVGAIWYRKDLAKQYLGTDDPKELSTKFANWDDFLKAGETIKTQSGGKVFLTPNAADTMEALIGSLKTAGKSYVDGTKLTVKENMSSAFTLIESGLKSGYIGKLEGPAADAAWSNGQVVFFPSAAWREGFIPSVDKEGKDRWNVMLPPGGSYFRGGTAELVVDNKDKQKAELAALFIKQSLYTEEGMKVNIKNGNTSAIKEIVDKKLSNGVNPFYGADLTATFYDWLGTLAPVKYGPYDSLIEDELKFQANAMQKSGITTDEAVNTAIKNIKSKSDELQ